MKNLFFGFSLLVLVFASCKKEDTAPPDSNAQGEYFNCKIDGTYWTYKQAYFTSRKALTFTSYFNDAGYELSGDNVVDFPQTLVSFRVTTGVGFPDKDTVELTSYGAGAFAEIVGPNRELANLDFSTDTAHNGRLVFAKRTPERLEGTFYFDAYRKEGAPIIHITEGRFSIIP